VASRAYNVNTAPWLNTGLVTLTELSSRYPRPLPHFHPCDLGDGYRPSHYSGIP
jgi:hypothetical protein